VPNFNFDDLQFIFANVDIEKYSLVQEEFDYDPGEFVLKNVFEHDLFTEIKSKLDITDKDIGLHFENFDPYLILRLLMENPKNQNLELEWRTQDVIEGGWVSEDSINSGLNDTDKFLIVTEGSTDTFIISRAIKMLTPEIEDFFTFVDMEEKYPFTGAGNLYNFCQGLSSIQIQNKTLVLFDNDLEGVEKYQKTQQLDLPSSMKIMKLPELRKFDSFPTIGPSGEGMENINGKAVAIECFLDFAGFNPKVRWTNYKKDFNNYQGALENKTQYVKSFKKSLGKESTYDFDKLLFLIEEIYKNCL